MKAIKIFCQLVLTGAFSILLGLAIGASPLVLFIILALLSFVPQPQGVFKVVTSNPLIGKSRKSMGNATFSSWKGINVLKEKPTSVANPNTHKQQSQRGGMTKIVSIYRKISGEVQAGFAELANKKSEYNAFTSYNVVNAIDNSAPPAHPFIPAAFRPSNGSIGATPITVHTFDRSDNLLSLQWDPALLPVGGSATDQSHAVFYNATKDDWTVKTGDSFRDGGETGDVTMPATWATGDVIHAYLFFTSVTSNKSSVSTYATATVVA